MKTDLKSHIRSTNKSSKNDKAQIHHKNLTLETSHKQIDKKKHIEKNQIEKNLGTPSLAPTQRKLGGSISQVTVTNWGDGMSITGFEKMVF